MLRRVKEERNNPHKIKRRKANRIGHILCRKCLLKLAIGGKIERRIIVMGIRLRGRKQLLVDVKEKKENRKFKKKSTISHSEDNSLCKRLWTC